MTEFKVSENGKWTAGAHSDGEQVFVQSDDFNHDVRMYISGDFVKVEDKLLYAEEIAKRLNSV